jgi:hypothetical protein
VGEELDEVGVQGDVAVVAELADRDAQPIGVADLGDGVGGEVAELAGTQPGAGEHLDHEAVAREPVGPGGGHELGGVLVVEELGERFWSGWDVAVEDRVAARRVGPVPFDEPLQEDADHAESLALGVLGQRRTAGSGLSGEPHLVVLDVSPGDVGDDGDVGVGCEPAGQLPQGVVGDINAARGEERGELDQVAAHRGRQLRCRRREDSPLAVGLITWKLWRVRFDRGHGVISWSASNSAAWPASIRSAARRYSAASQSLVRCR